MGHFRFRRSVKIAPGLKLNFNKNSTSLTFGGKGMHYTVNSKGKRTKSIGIPGTGISYVDIKSTKKSSKQINDVQYHNNIQNEDNYMDYQESNNYYQQNDNNYKKPLLQRIWFIVLMLVFVTPFGIFLMWYNTEWKKGIKIGISIFAILYFTIYCMMFA